MLKTAADWKSAWNFPQVKMEDRHGLDTDRGR